MNIIINGQTTKLDAARSIAEALNENGYANKIVAVAHNGSFVPRALHAKTILNEGDEIEIVAPMQGG